MSEAMSEAWIVTQNHWAYGESAEAGDEPRLRAGEHVVEVGPRERKATYVRRENGVIWRASLEALRRP